MVSRYDEMKRVSQEHAESPMVGDYWHEMFTPIVVILDVRGEWLTICRKRKEVDLQHWEWDLEHEEDIRAHELFEWLSYKSIPGYWANVAPQKCKETADYWMENKSRFWAAENFIQGLA